MSLRELFKRGISFIELLNKSDEPYRNKCEEIMNNIKLDEDMLNKIKDDTPVKERFLKWLNEKNISYVS